MRNVRFSLLVLCALFMIMNGVRAQGQGQIQYGTYSVSIRVVSINQEGNFRIHTGDSHLSSVVFFDNPSPGSHVVTHQFPFNQRPVIGFSSISPPMFTRWYSLENSDYFENKIIDRDRWGTPLFGTFEMSFLPTAIRFYQPFINPSGEQNWETTSVLFLNNYEELDVAATRDFSPGSYNWQYSLDKGISWQDFPIDNIWSHHHARLMFRRDAFFSTAAEFYQFLDDGRYIKIRINVPTYEPQIPVRVIPVRSSPRVIRYDSVRLATCHGGRDAQVRLIFNRALDDDEILKVFKNDDLTECSVADEDIELELDNSLLITGLGAGVWYFRGVSSLPGVELHRSPAHRVTIPERPEVRHEIIHERSRHTCYDTDNGEIAVRVWGGTGIHTVRLYKNDDLIASLPPSSLREVREGENSRFYGVFPGLSQGFYRVTAVDSNGCLSEDNRVDTERNTIRIDELRPLEILDFNPNDPEIYGEATGWVEFRVRGGTGINYTATLTHPNDSLSTYSPIPNGDTFSFFELPAGDYKVRIEDSNGCWTEHRFTLFNPIRLTTSYTNITCHNENNGIITVSATGGSGSFIARLYRSPFWMDGNFLQSIPFSQGDTISFSGLSPGNYEIRVVDAYDTDLYDESEIITIINPPLLVVTIPYSTMPSSYNSLDGYITVSVRGGTGYYRITLTHLESEDAPLSYTLQLVDDGYAYASHTFRGLTAGLYSILVRDANNCTFVSDTIPLIASIHLTIISYTDITCHNKNDGIITVTATGGSGRFIAKQYYSPFTIGDTPLQQIDFLHSGYALFDSLSQGNYVIRVIDANDADWYADLYDKSEIITIINPLPLDVTISGAMPESYNSIDGRITVSVSGGTGNYRITLTPFDGTPVLYFLTAVENETVSHTFTGLAAGLYSVIVEDENYCTFVSDTFTLTAQINHEIISVSPVSCNGGNDGQIIVSASGGSRIFTARLYRDGIFFRSEDFTQVNNGVFDGLIAGYYEVTVVDTDGASSQSTNVSDTITQPQPLTVTLEYTQPLAHDSQDGKITVRVGGGTKNAQGGYNVTLDLNGHLFSPASHSIDGDYVLYTFTGLGRGDYTINVRDGNNCPASQDFALNAPPPLIVTIEEIASIGRYGAPQGKLAAHVTGGVPFPTDMPYTFTWYKRVNDAMQPLAIPNNNIADNLLAGFYQVRVTDANEISKTSAVHHLTQPNPIVVELIVVSPNCYGSEGGSITALVSGGSPPFRFQWSVEGVYDHKLTGLEAGTYILLVTDTGGGRVDSLIVVPPAGNLIVNQHVVQPACLAPEGSITLTLSGAEAPFLVRWTDRPETISVAANETITRDGLMPGVYTVEITDGNDCINILSFEIVPLPEFTVSIGDDLVMNRNQSRTMEAISNQSNLTYLWYFNGARLPDTGNSIVVDRAGEFTVIATNEYGCTATDRINVRMTNYILDLDMTVPTKVEIGSQVHAVNLSTMAADRIDWLLPEGTTVIEQSDTRLIFRFDQLGSHTISMEGFRGEGASIVTRTIQVVGVGEVDLPEESLIRQFWASPNPSTGEFRVQVELSQPGDFTMRLYSPEGVLMDTREGRNVEVQTFDYEIAGVLQGTFVLHLITGADKSVLQIVIRR